ncbi:peptidoglycan DD-metalloendopeptidase family protein [Roseixanthobacter glucoisosaccharinicivorans]|uniref:peptidoglycan DD-metalloendopeptidase family protein n=1 Tax=Roseixanthobacter glucoisosaccharinicivorans TaxID=3119923 RepID=UPI003729BF44
MLSSRETLGQNVLARLAMVGLVSGALAGCSSDSARFSAPGPMASQGSPEVTGSLGAAPTGRVDSGPIASAPLAPAGPPVAYAAPPPPPSGGQPLYGAPNYGAATYASAPPAPAPTHTAARGASHVVTSGETLTSVAQSYGMTRAHLAQVNGISPDAQLKIGQTLVVPPGTAGNLAQIRPAPAAAKPSVVAVAPPPPAPPPAAPKTVVAAKPATAPSAPTSTVTAASPSAAAPAKVASAGPAKVETAAKVTPADDADESTRAPGSGPQFRAPVRGRVISGFGPKPGGARNDGVNFAVPEGTGVRAAEDGTVAYAGNELKGYGNLVLIKHADGYVTAYAHNSELLVKRGDTVRRGQIVAKAGQSGGVSTPQLHFEIRKGSQPVDPSQYVAGL